MLKVLPEMTITEVHFVMEKLKKQLFVMTSLLFPSSVSVLLWEN